ncbi:uncharacterized protein [Setaria viridis]|uniref:uncharacterized protein n=1 Tax=Setaria viridis TaxID=4556 RepID=UPI003B3AAA1C
MVDDLYEANARTWNEQLVRQTFIAIDADEILKIQPNCPWARRFWKTVKEVTGEKLPGLHPATWTTDLILGTICSKEEAALFVCGCWSLWSSRNDRVHGRTNWNPAAAVKHVANIVEELMCMGPRGVSVEPRVVERWKPPEEGWVKVNSDGSFDACRGQGAGAAVLRDHLGRVRAAQARWYGSIREVLMAEAMAASGGLQLASTMGLPKVVLESDNSVLVSAIKMTMTDRSIIAGI